MAKVKKVSNGVKPWRCEKCHRRFKTHQTGRQHYYAKHEPKKKCLSPNCKSNLCNIDSLRRHVKHFHPNLWEARNDLSKSFEQGRPRGTASSSSSGGVGETKIRTSARQRKELVASYVEDSHSESDQVEHCQDVDSDFQESLLETPSEGESYGSEYEVKKKGKAKISPKKASAGGRGRGKKVSPKAKAKTAPKARGRPGRKTATAASTPTKKSDKLQRSANKRAKYRERSDSEGDESLHFRSEEYEARKVLPKKATAGGRGGGKKVNQKGKSKAEPKALRTPASVASTASASPVCLYGLKSFSLHVQHVNCPDCGRHFASVKAYFLHRREINECDLPLMELNMEPDPCMSPDEYKVIVSDNCEDSLNACRPSLECDNAPVTESDSISEAAPQGDSPPINGVRKTSSKLSVLAAKYTGGQGKMNDPASNNSQPNTLPLSFLKTAQDLVDCKVANYFQLSQKLGAEIAEQAALVRKAFDAQKRFLAVATAHTKPNNAGVQKLLTDTANAINEIQQFREERRASAVFNHLTAVSESVPALDWVNESLLPGPHIQRMSEAAKIYTNRVLQDFKEKKHSDWTKSWIDLLLSLLSYVRQNHTFGLVWGEVPHAYPGAI